MTRLDWYVGKTLLAATLLAWSVIVVLDALFSFLGELGDVGRGGYGLAEAGLFTLLSLPGGAWQTFPMAALIGCLLGLGSLSVQREVTAFRLAGCSPARLMRSVLQVGALMLVAAIAIGEVLAPQTRELSVQLRASALYADVAVQRDAGFWVRDENRLIRIGDSTPDGSLIDLAIYEMDATPRLLSAAAVASARYGDGQWLLDDVRETAFAEQRIEVNASAHSRRTKLVDPTLAQLLSRDAQTFNLFELPRYISYLRDNGSDVAAWRLNYWQRLAAPLAVFAMLFLSVSLVLGPLGSQSVGKRVLIGVLIGLAFKLVNDISAYAGLVYGIPPWLNSASPSLLVLAAGTLLMRRFG